MQDKKICKRRRGIEARSQKKIARGRAIVPILPFPLIRVHRRSSAVKALSGLNFVERKTFEQEAAEIAERAWGRTVNGDISSDYDSVISLRLPVAPLLKLATAGMIQPMSAADLEKRLALVERELARLKNTGLRARPSHPIEARERMHGTFEGDDAFREARRLGRQWRKGQGPRPVKKKAQPR
jgi:hypothetical protein